MVRIRPATLADEARGKAKGVTVPLYQRVALVRKLDPSLSKTEAQRRAMQQGQQCDKLEASIVGYDATTIHALAPYVGAKAFKFDAVLGEASSQADVWSQCLPTVNEVLNGRDGCLFCYGQSGAGKTHTIFGSDEEMGLAGRAISHLLKGAKAKGFSVKATYVEVFGNALRDLTANAPIRAAR